MDIRKLVRPNIRSLRAYQAEDIRCTVKLDANESPYGYRMLPSVRTNRYPDPTASALRRILARRHRVSPDNILLGNGSDELISCLITTFGGPVAYPVPTFSMYGIISEAQGETHLAVPLDRGFDLDMAALMMVVKKQKPKIVFLSSPNNPTGNSFSSEKMMKIIREARGVVVVDEAYQPYSGRKSFMPLLRGNRHLVVLRTLSKVGLAGMRVGYMIAHPDVIHEVNKVRLPFNVNVMSQKIACEAMRNGRKMRESVQAIIAERKRVFSTMKEIPGILPYPSDANFILFRVNEPDAVHRGLLRKGILIRNMKGVVDGCLRVTIGTPRENTAFLRALKGLT